MRLNPGPIKTLGMAVEKGARRYRDRVIDALASTSLVRRAVYRKLAGDGNLVLRRLPDHDIVVDPSDLIGRTILEKGDFDRQRTDLVTAHARTLTNRTTILEIGANIGTQTVYFLATGLFDKVICLEPDPANLPVLETNLHLNRLTQMVTVLPLAAGDRPGSLTLRRVPGNCGGSTLRTEEFSDSLATETLVPVVTLDSLVEDGTIDPDAIGLIWVDAEGFEEEIFAGSAILLNRKTPMVFEFSTAFYNEQKVVRIVDLIFASYTSVSIVNDAGFTPITRDQMIGLPRLVDIFCS